MKSKTNSQKQKTLSQVLIVEDQPDWRNHFFNALSGQGYAVAKASNLPEARFHLQKSLPTVVVLDMQLGEISFPSQGLILLNEIKPPPYGPQIIVVTGTVQKSAEIIRLLKKRDFDGYEIFDFLPKQDFTPGLLRKTVRKAADMAETLMKGIPASPLRLRSFHEVNTILVKKKFEALTEREYEVLERLILGDSNPEIAVVLDLDTETIKTHVKNILAKFLIDGRTRFLLFAIKIGLIE
jgi:DNA-binding NarL/FixJ family response regulator